MKLSHMTIDTLRITIIIIDIISLTKKTKDEDYLDWLSLESIFYPIDQDSQRAWRIYLEHGVIA